MQQGRDYVATTEQWVSDPKKNGYPNMKATKPPPPPSPHQWGIALYEYLLSQDKNTSSKDLCVRWGTGGQGFVVQDQEKVQKEVL